MRLVTKDQIRRWRKSWDPKQYPESKTDLLSSMMRELCIAKSEYTDDEVEQEILELAQREQKDATT